MFVFSPVFSSLPVRVFPTPLNNCVKVAMICMLNLIVSFFGFMLLDLLETLTWFIILSFLKHLCVWPPDLRPWTFFLVHLCLLPWWPDLLMSWWPLTSDLQPNASLWTPYSKKRTTCWMSPLGESSICLQLLRFLTSWYLPLLLLQCFPPYLMNFIFPMFKSNTLVLSFVLLFLTNPISSLSANPIGFISKTDPPYLTRMVSWSDLGPPGLLLTWPQSDLPEGESDSVTQNLPAASCFTPGRRWSYYKGL